MKWTIDPAHSTVSFAVRYVGISSIQGRLTPVRGTVEATEDGRLEAIEAFIAADSVDTGVSERDAHLRSADFLDAARYPELSFRSSAVEALEGRRYRIRGEITVRNHPHTAIFEEVSPPSIDEHGYRRAEAVAIGRFSRKELGLAWDRILRFGGFLVADEVEVSLTVEAVMIPSPDRTGRSTDARIRL